MILDKLMSKSNVTLLDLLVVLKFNCAASYELNLITSLQLMQKNANKPEWTLVGLSLKRFAKNVPTFPKTKKWNAFFNKKRPNWATSWIFRRYFQRFFHGFNRRLIFRL